ncbi:sulfotransferase [Candidatus Parcubacteria bacterium]|nr:sulfotransferase [Candidatus Parcubacteria bacterium]
MEPHEMTIVAQLRANLRGDFETGWKIAQHLEKTMPHNNRVAFNRGWHLLQQGDLQGGMALLDRGRFEKVFGSPALPCGTPIWNPDLGTAGKTILLRSEGGLGDEMINVRFATLLAERGARVIVACDKGLAPLFSRVKGVAEVIEHKDVCNTKHDSWVPAMSAARLLGLTYGTLSGKSYLSADPAYAEKWKGIINGPELKIGIRWSGNPQFEHEQYRRFDPSPLIALSQIPGVKVYSLQRDADLRELPPEVVDLKDKLETWEDTAGAIANLDLVITSCTSITHLAAGMGKETWVIVPILPYYMWALPGERSPWYESVRVFRQEAFGDWSAPLQRVFRAVSERVGAASSETVMPTVAPTPAPDISYLPKEPAAPGPSSSLLVAAPYTLHFIAGLPRSGSTMLTSLLSQNPRLHGAPVSGLVDILTGIYSNWDKIGSHMESPNKEAKRAVLLSALNSYHAPAGKPVVVDKSRGWISHIPLLEELLGRKVKILVPVRPVVEILASFEKLRNRDPLELTGADEALGAGSNVASRAQYFAGPGGPVGIAYNATKEAVQRGYMDRLLFIDYNKLVTDPEREMRRIYEFWGEPYFAHDFNNIEQQGTYDSYQPHRFVGLHDIRPKIERQSASPVEILGGEVVAIYAHPEPWEPWV